jgi:hypothetical protein
MKHCTKHICVLIITCLAMVCFIVVILGQDSSVQWLAMGWMTRVQSLEEAKIFSSPLCLDQCWGPLNFLFSGTGATAWSGSLPLSSVKVKNAWSCTSTPSHLHGMVLWHRDDFNFIIPSSSSSSST